jgi:hypothetical protein
MTEAGRQNAITVNARCLFQQEKPVKQFCSVRSRRTLVTRANIVAMLNATRSTNEALLALTFTFHRVFLFFSFLYKFTCIHNTTKLAKEKR